MTITLASACELDNLDKPIPAWQSTVLEIDYSRDELLTVMQSRDAAALHALKARLLPNPADLIADMRSDTRRACTDYMCRYNVILEMSEGLGKAGQLGLDPFDANTFLEEIEAQFLADFPPGADLNFERLREDAHSYLCHDWFGRWEWEESLECADIDGNDLWPIDEDDDDDDDYDGLYPPVAFVANAARCQFRYSHSPKKRAACLALVPNAEAAIKVRELLRWLIANKPGMIEGRGFRNLFDWWGEPYGSRRRDDRRCHHDLRLVFSDGNYDLATVVTCEKCGAGGNPLSMAEGHFGHSLATDAVALLAAIEADLDKPVTETEGSIADRIVSVDWETEWDAAPEDEEWLVEGLIPAEAQVMIFAAAKTGKSLLALAVAAALAAGRPVLRQAAGAPVEVLYIDFENSVHHDVIPRLRDLGYEAGDVEKLHFFSFPPIDAMDTRAGGGQMEALLEKYKPRLVVLDSFARVVEGKENDADTVRAYYIHTAAALKRHRAASLRLDNVGHDTTHARGTTAKIDDVDIAWGLAKRDGGLRLKLHVQRRKSAQDTIDLKLVNDPHLRYVVVGDSWPTGTQECSAMLDRLGVPLDTTNKQAREMIKAASETAASETLSAALRFRKSADYDGDGTSGTPSGTPLPGSGGTSGGTLG
jgi:hypothetical protein